MSCFDQLLMLSEGHVVYFGSPKDSLGYLNDVVGLPCPPGYNAADHWMDLLVNDLPVGFDEEIGTGEESTCEGSGGGGETLLDVVLQRQDGKLRRVILQEAWKEHCMGNGDLTEHGLASGGHVFEAIALQSVEPQKYPTTWWQQYKVLTHRALKNSRSAIFTPLNLIKSLALGIVAGLLYFQLDYTEANVYDIQSYYFFTMTVWVIESMFDSLMSFPPERDVILRERASKSYRLSAYFMAKTTADAPTRILLPFLYMFVSYWMAGIDNSFGVFIGSVGCTLLSVMAGEALGLFIGAAMYDMEKALTTLTVVALFLMLVGGFFVQNPPGFVAWAKWISPFKYSFDSSIQLVFNRPLPCDGSGSLAGVCPPDSEGQFVSGADVANAIGVQGSIGFNVGMLIVIALIPRYFAYVCLRLKKEGERA